MLRKIRSGTYLFKHINTWAYHSHFLLGFFLLFLLSCTSSLPAQSGKVDTKTQRYYANAQEAFKIRDYETASAYLIKAEERAPDFIDIYLLRSEIAYETNDIEGCRSSLERAIDIDPHAFPPAHFNLGDVYMTMGNYEKAEKNFANFSKIAHSSHALSSKAREMEDRARFAQKLKKNPVSFDPQNLGQGINSELNEYYPSFTVDDKSILFTRRVAGGKYGEQEDFFRSIVQNGDWANSMPLKEINTPFNEGAPTISADGMVMIFTACAINRDEEYSGGKRGMGSCDLFYSESMGGKWSRPVNMGSAINSWHWETQPSLSSDGRTLYFVRGHRSKGSMKIKNHDIFFSQLSDEGIWSKAERLPSTVNTDGNESSVMIHPDGKTLYFSSTGHFGMGGEDIFVTRKGENNSWSEPINLGYPINTHAHENSLTVLASGDIAVMASNRSGGKGGLDLYQFELPEFARSTPVSYLKGKILAEDTKKPLGARFEIIDVVSGKLVAESFSDRYTGEFLVPLPTEKIYALNASKNGYLFYSENFDFDGVDQVKPQEKEILLEPIKEGSKLVLRNVFFDTDQAKLKEESIPELNKMFQLLSIQSGLHVEIGGHTDSEGDDSHNQALSERRALAVLNYLIDSGIDASRLTSKGYGELNPIASNNTEEGRAQNRRTEIRITSIK